MAKKLSIAIPFILAQINAQNTTQDYIVNGNFETPAVPTWKIFTNSIAGWTGKQIEIGKGSIYNKNWTSKNQVTQLNANQNTAISQTVNLTQGQYALDFDYCARQGTTPATASMSVYWNNNLVKEIKPKNMQINHQSIVLKAKQGNNIIEFRGQGSGGPAGYGVTLDNVSLKKSQTNQILKNINEKNDVQVQTTAQTTNSPKINLQAVNKNQIKQPTIIQDIIENVDKKIDDKIIIKDTNNIIDNGEIKTMIKEPKLTSSITQQIQNNEAQEKTVKINQPIKDKLLVSQPIVQLKDKQKQNIEAQEKTVKINQPIKDKLLVSQPIVQLKDKQKQNIEAQEKTVKINQPIKDKLLVSQPIVQLKDKQKQKVPKQIQNIEDIIVGSNNQTLNNNQKNSRFNNHLFQLNQKKSNKNLKHQVSNTKNIFQQKTSKKPKVQIPQITKIKQSINIQKPSRYISKQQNLIKNPDFELPKTQKPFTGKIDQWDSYNVQIGQGKLYNHNWSSQIIKLGDNQNQYLSQQIELDPGLYILSFQWAAIQGNNVFGQLQVLFNKKMVMSLKPTDSQIHKEKIKIKSSCSNQINIIQFKSSRHANKSGITLDNIQLVKA